MTHIQTNVYVIEFERDTHYGRFSSINSSNIESVLMLSDIFSSGAETGWADLTALAVVSIQLFDKDGSTIQVSDPIHISVPLPSDTRNRMATSVPTWLYQPKTGKEYT